MALEVFLNQKQNLQLVGLLEDFQKILLFQLIAEFLIV